MSIYWANKYASIEAKTAMMVLPKTLSNISLLIGDHDVAGTSDDTVTINKEKKEANIPAVTI